MAKNGKSKGVPAAKSGKAVYRSSGSGRLVGTAKDGVKIIGPKGRSRHFTPKEARDAVTAARDAKRA